MNFIQRTFCAARSAVMAARNAGALPARLVHDSTPRVPPRDGIGQAGAQRDRIRAWKAVELTAADREEVRRFFDGLGIDTLSEAEGSRCALRSQSAGLRESHEFASAVKVMVGRFDVAVSPRKGIRSACIGLRDADGALVGISFLEGVGGDSRRCRTHGLTIADAHQGQGGGTALKIAQLEHARALGFTRAELVLDLSDMKGVAAAEKGAAELPVVKLQRKAAAKSKFQLHGPAELDEASMVMWFELGEAR